MGFRDASEIFKTALRVLSSCADHRLPDQADESFLRREEGDAQTPIEELARVVIQRKLGQSGDY